MRFVVAPFIVATFLCWQRHGPAHAQVDSREGIALQNQIYQLRQELKSVQDQAARGGGSPGAPAYAPPPQQAGGSDLLAQLLTRVDALEDQVRQLRGRIDETQNQLQRQNDDLGKRIDDLAFQISPQGGQPGARPAASAAPSAVRDRRRPRPSPPPPRPPAAPGPRTPEAGVAGRQCRPGPPRLSGRGGGSAGGAGQPHLAPRL